MGSSPSAPQPRKPEPASHKAVFKEGQKDAYWSHDRKAGKEIIYSEEGISSQKGVTLSSVLKQCAEMHPDKVTLRVERDANGSPVLGKTEGQWYTWTWKQYYEDARKAGRALMHLGLERFDCVSIIGFNSPEWFIGYMGSVLAGGIGAGIYTTNSPDSCEYIVNHSDSKVIICEDQKQLDKFIKIKDKLTGVKAIVVYTNNWDPEKSRAAAGDSFAVHGWKEFLDLSEKTSDKDLDARMDEQVPGNICAFIYTSGTTGNPKAVMLSHDNISFNALGVLSIIQENTTIGNGKEERILSYLPLSHVAGLMVDIVTPMMCTMRTKSWIRVDFARPDALKGTLPDALKNTRPSIFLGVPRVWEKIREAMVAKVRANPPTGVKKSLANWAKKTGKKMAYNQQLGASGEKPWGLSFAEKFVFSTVKDALGLDKCEFAFTGAAPITVDVLEFFGQFQIQINEVYGMSESTGATTWSSSDSHTWGSCGYEMPGVEVKLDFQADRDKEGEGELCYRGRHIMVGYMANPKLGEAHVKEIEAKNRSAIDDDGWLHSGDVGRVDKHGMYYITGRIKELIIGAGGENIAPVPIEDTIKRNLPALSNVMMVGDKRKYNTCLLTLKAKLDPETNMTTDELDGEALDVNPEVKTVTAAMTDSKWKAYIENGIAEYNKKAVSRAQKIQKFRILKQDFSEAGGELTATLKLKRSKACEKHADIIEEMYSGTADAAKPAGGAEEKQAN